MGLVEQGVEHTGATVSVHNWETTGSHVPGIVQVLRSYGLKHARSVTGAGLLTHRESFEKLFWLNQWIETVTRDSSGHYTCIVTHVDLAGLVSPLLLFEFRHPDVPGEFA